MNALQQKCQDAIGRTGTIVRDGMTIHVVVIAAKAPYGNLMLTVRQIDGQGELLVKPCQLMVHGQLVENPGGFREDGEAKP